MTKKVKNVARLRIISGEFGGRLIKAPEGRTTHPMGDRVRSALFNMIDVQGKTVLDAYAGSGAIGLEAISRGAEIVDFVENDKQAQKVIENNIDSLNVKSRAKLYKMGIGTFLNVQKDNKYDVVFVDPPYKNFKELSDGSVDFSTALKLKSLVKLNGLMVVSYKAGLCVPTVNGVVVVDNRNYGDAALLVLSFVPEHH